MPVVNDPQTLAEFQQIFADYEAALLRNDIDALNGFFWDDPQTLRYGIAELGYGHAAICEYRRTTKPVDPRRCLCRTVLITYGTSMGSASTEFTMPESPMIGRQSQTWFRFPQGWRIVAAHVSQLESRLLAVPK